MSVTDRPVSIRVRRQTRETSFGITLETRSRPNDPIGLANQVLGHLLDHLLKAAGLSLRIAETNWPGSWRLDHVLCEDMGQLIGCGIGKMHDKLANRNGVAGRSSATACMDEVVVEVTVSFEGRARCNWEIPRRADIDGFVDAWYDESDRMMGWACGTNLRQFFDGLAQGGLATIDINIRRTGNLHHVFEATFRALGDAIGTALGLGSADSRVPGESSGFAGRPEYVVEVEEAVQRA